MVRFGFELWSRRKKHPPFSCNLLTCYTFGYYFVSPLFRWWPCLEVLYFLGGIESLIYTEFSIVESLIVCCEVDERSLRPQLSCIWYYAIRARILKKLFVKGRLIVRFCVAAFNGGRPCLYPDFFLYSRRKETQLYVVAWLIICCLSMLESDFV
jgi:hypothetical protein